MNPLGTVALGLLLVLLDLRIGGFDVLADVVGWVVAASGLARLTELDRRFGGARAAAVASGVLSLADLVQPQRTITTGSTTTTVGGTPDGWLGVVDTCYSVAMVVAAVLLCLALRDRAREHAEPELAMRFGQFAVLHVVLGTVVLVLSVVALSFGTDGRITPQGPAAALTLLFVLVALAIEVWFLLTLSGARTRWWLQPVGSSAGAE